MRERVLQDEVQERVLRPVQVPVQQQRAQGQELGRAPKHRHNLWRRWRGSKKNFSSIRQRSFSKPRHRRCANC